MPSRKLQEKETERVKLVLEKLAEQYPQARTGLVYKNRYQLFVATVLSAQTTDKQVNKLTADLFCAVPSFHVLSRKTPSELEPYLQSLGLFRNKSRFLIEAARIIVEKYDGRVPEDFDRLIKLPGVGRKTASIIISNAFGKPALAVDTHVFRVSRRLGLAEGKDVITVEEQLKQVIPRKEWIAVHHRLIAHGRTLCFARSPKCRNCFLVSLCLYVQGRGEFDDLEKVKSTGT